MLKDQLKKDQIAAIKEGDSFKRLVLSTLLAALKMRELEKRTQLSRSIQVIAELEQQSQLTDEETERVIAGEVKKRKEAIEQFKKAGRGELAAKEEKEIGILNAYLPMPASREEIAVAVAEAIKEKKAAGSMTIGPVIAAARLKLKNRAEGQVISEMVKEKLGL